MSCDPTYWEMFGFSFVATIVFVALVAPEAIVRDRRDGMFALYLSTPLARPSYLVAKVLAVLGTMSLDRASARPCCSCSATRSRARAPTDVLDWMSVMGRILLAGLVICTVYTAVSLGVSSLTDRRAFASIAVVFVMLGALDRRRACWSTSPDFSDNWRILDPIGGALEIAPRLFGDRSDDVRRRQHLAGRARHVAGWTALGAALLDRPLSQAGGGLMADWAPPVPPPAPPVVRRSERDRRGRQRHQVVR